jgi:hypothetical protein
MNVEEIEVVYLGMNDGGKRQLSRKAVYGKPDEARTSSPPPPPAAMSEDELNVIAKAIEGVKDF